jgi:limonene-1,2-epoxide hydrolase
VDWDDYKATCSRPDVFSRELLNWTNSHLAASEITQRITAVLDGSVLTRPADSRTDPRTDMFAVTLSAADVQTILERLSAAVFVKTGRYRHATIVWEEYLNHLNNLGAQSMDAQTRVTALMQAFDNKNIDGIAACFAPNAIYHNIPMEAVHGVEAIRASLVPFIGMASEIKFEVLHSAANGNVVMNERVDRFKIGEKWLAIKVMGVFEVGANGITAWRDYFDLGQFQSQMAAIQAG